jgi:hypothetical protein
MIPPLNISIFGSSLVSAYWNGAATYYRGLVRALHERGHRITFYEPDAYQRQQHRDIEDPEWARVVVYPARPEEALAAVERARGSDLVLKASGVGVFDELLEQAVLELQNPRVLVDGAHNAASIDAMMRAIGQHIPYDSMVVIFGCCGDKDVAGMLEGITSGADKVIFTNVNNVRTADPEELAARYVEQYRKMAHVAPTLAGALEIANRAVTKEDLICITGSFYLVGEAKKLFASNLAPVRPV